MFDRPIVLLSEQLDFYSENGYLVINNVLNDSECDKALEAFEYHRNKTKDRQYRGIMNLDRPEEWKHVYGAKGSWVHSYVREMLIKHPAIVTMLENLQGVEPGGVVVMQSMFLFKKAGSAYGEQAWNPHQDGTYHGASYGATLTANIALADQDRENGCMFIYPGSHKEGFLKAEERKSFHEDKGQRPGHDVTKALPQKYVGKEIDLTLKGGSVLFLHGAVVHGSYPNTSSNRDRPMLLCPYKTAGVTFTPGATGKRREIPIR